MTSATGTQHLVLLRRLIIALLVVLVLGSSVLGWLMLRQPSGRNRGAGAAARNPATLGRRVLAPRAVALAGAILAVTAAAAMGVPRLRAGMLSALPARQKLGLLVLLIQTLVAVSAVAYCVLFIQRQYGKPVWSVSHDRILRRIWWRAWPDALEIKRRLPPNARVAMKWESKESWLMPTLAYPIAFYSVYPSSEDDWRADRDFARTAESEALTHLLLYRPFQRNAVFRIRYLDEGQEEQEP